MSGTRPVSVQTVRTRTGLKSRVPAKKPELSQYLKNARMAFSRAHVGWNNPQWRRVLFSDESRFYLKRVDSRKRIWRRRRERYMGRDFSDCTDRPGLHRMKPECTALYQRSPYATRAAVSAPDTSRQYKIPG